MNAKLASIVIGCITALVALAAGQTDDRQPLADPDPQARLKAALPLARQHDEQAVGVLIELLADLKPAERRQAESVLQELAEDWAPNPGLTGDDEVSRRIRRDAWAAWWRNTDGPALLAAFRKRTLNPEQMAKAKELIVQLGDKAYAVRERASAELTALGPAVIPMLRRATPGADLEQLRRLEKCITQIEARAKDDALPHVAARLLAVRKPAGAAEALLAYLPCTEDEVMQWEVSKALNRLAVQAGKPDPALVKALQDPVPIRRAAAGEVLAAATDAEIRAAVRKLLADPHLSVRLRVAVALACAADRDAVPVLIDLLAELPADQVWQADEILRTVAGGKAPPLGAADGVAAWQKLQGAWRTWYAAHGAQVKLAPQPVPPPLLGFTTITAFSPPPDRTRSRVLEVDRHGKVRWQFTATYPIDVHVLPNNRVLLSEGEANRVTERDFKGNIHWQVDTPNMPYNVQRLANGNTFVAARTHLLEFDPAGKLVFDRPIEQFVAAVKLPDGQIVYLTGRGDQCIRLDGSGKVVQQFASDHNGESGCVLDFTSRGRLLVTQGYKKMAEEFDLEGKSLWRTPGPVAPGILTEVRNGHFMVASFAQSAVLELDRSGKTVWRYEVPGYHPFIARKR